MHFLPLLVLAAAFWGQTPACGQPTIQVASLQEPVVGLADLGACMITLDPADLHGAGIACMAVVHEYGHLLGLGHSTDPEDVMYPLLTVPRWPCAW